MKKHSAAREAWKVAMDNKEKRKLYNIVDRWKLTEREAKYKFTDDLEASWAIKLPPLLKMHFLEYPKGRYISGLDWIIRDKIKEWGMEWGVKFIVTRAPWREGWLVTDEKRVAAITLRREAKHKYQYTKRGLITEEFKKLGVRMIDYYGDDVKLEEDIVGAFNIDVDSVIDVEVKKNEKLTEELIDDIEVVVEEIAGRQPGFKFKAVTYK